MYCEICSSKLALERIKGVEVRIIIDSFLDIEPNKEMIVTSRSHSAFYPRRIVIVQDYDSFIIKDFIIGKQCQYQDDVPGHVFRPIDFPISCHYDIVPVACDITFAVKNIGDKPVRFIAHLSGLET